MRVQSNDELSTARLRRFHVDFSAQAVTGGRLQFDVFKRPLGSADLDNSQQRPAAFVMAGGQGELRELERTSVVLQRLSFAHIPCFALGSRPGPKR